MVVYIIEKEMHKKSTLVDILKVKCSHPYLQYFPEMEGSQKVDTVGTVAQISKMKDVST